MVRNRLEFIASATYVEIEIKAPINAPLMSMKVSAAKTVAFSTDSKLTIVIYPYLCAFSSSSLVSSSSSFLNTSLNIVAAKKYSVIASANSSHLVGINACE